MKTIHFHGVLKQFGELFKLQVDSAAEATHAIACQNPEFKMFMVKAELNGMRFEVLAGDNRLDENEIGNHTAAETIHVIPRVAGAGGNDGLFQFIVGAVLVGLSFTPFGAPFAPALQGAGLGLMIGGAASMLMPTPDMGAQDEDGNRANYGFGGAVTTVAQGNPVPILYGDRYIGGFVNSAGIYTEDTQ